MSNIGVYPNCSFCTAADNSEAMSLAQRLIVKVVNKLGGVDMAATRLEVSPSLLMRFVEGTMNVPDAVLLRVVDYLLDELPPTPKPPHAGDELPKSL